MNAPRPRQIANRLNRLRANIAANPVSAPPPKASFWEKFMFYAKGGYDTPNGPFLPNKAVQSENIETATVSAPYVMTATPFKTANKAVTPKSVAGFLFMPQIGQSLKSLTFAWTMLIQIMAGILVSNRLLPADHPATTYRGAQQTKLLNLFRTARQNFSFNVKDAPRAIVWLSLVAFIFVVGGLLTTAAAKLVFSTAHAQTAATVGSPGVHNADLNGDVASKLLDSFFGFGAYSKGGVPAINTIITAFDNMILILGGIILIMTIISVIAETARTGVPFGKNFNPVWAPIRLIIAIAFMVPLANGLSSGQNILINVVKWSSEFATEQVWLPFSNKVFSGNNSISGVIRDTQGESQVVFNEFMRIAMIELNNKKFCKDNSEALTCRGVTLTQMEEYANGGTQFGKNFVSPDLYTVPYTSAKATINSANGSASNVFFTAKTVELANPAYENYVDIGNPSKLNAAILKGKKLFGSVTIKAYDKDGLIYYFLTRGDPINAHAVASSALDTLPNWHSDPIVKALQLNFRSFMRAREDMKKSGYATKFAEAVVPEMDEITRENMILNLGDYIEAKMTEYQNQRNTDVREALEVLKTAATDRDAVGGDFSEKTLKAFGWVGAARYLPELARFNEAFQDAISAIPSVARSDSNDAVIESVVKAFDKLKDNTKLTDAAADWWDKDISAAAGAKRLFAKSEGGNIDDENARLDMIKLIFASAVFDVNSGSCDVNHIGTCEINDNPLLQLSKVGKFVTSGLVDALKREGDSNPKKKNIEDTSSYQSCITIYGAEQCAQFKKDAAKGLTNQTSKKLILPFVGPLLTYGFMLGFFLPLLPLFRYLLGFLGWLLLVFEAILAIPLLGIAHLKTDGEGIMGPMAQGGYLMILGLLIKPALMVIGLIAGLLIFNGAIQITAYTFFPIMLQETEPVFFAMNMLLFASFITVIGNSAFKTIDIIPNSVISWIGGRMDQKTGDAMEVQNNAMGAVNSLGSSINYAFAGNQSNSAINSQQPNSNVTASPSGFNISDPIGIKQMFQLPSGNQGGTVNGTGGSAITTGQNTPGTVAFNNSTQTNTSSLKPNVPGRMAPPSGSGGSGGNVA